MEEPEPSPSLGDAEPSDPVEAVPMYRFDLNKLDALARLVDFACEGIEDMYLVHNHLRQMNTLPDLDPLAVRELSATFDYRLTFDQERPKRFGASLQPLEGDSQFPCALRSSGSEVRKLWKNLADTAKHPIAQARFADIVFTLKLSENSQAAGARAVRAYLATISGALGPLDQATNLVRAWTITREVALIDLEQDAADAMTEFARGLLDDKEYAYAVLPVLQALTMPRPRGRTPWLPAATALLDRALTTYQSSHVVGDFADLARRRAGDNQARIEHASRIQVQAILAEADAATGGMAVRHHLNIAATEARRLNITDLAEQAEIALQQAPRIEWIVEELKVEIPDSVTGRFMRAFELAKTWQEILAIWFSTEAPSGDYATNQATAREATAISTFRALATTVVFRDGDLPARTLTGPEALFQQELARSELLAMSLYGALLAQALAMIKDRFAIPSETELQDFIESRARDIHSPYARIMAKALRLFLFGEFEAATHLVVPKVEAAARALLLHLSEPIYRTQVGDTDGHFLGLGALLPLLRNQGFDEDWERFFRTFLLSEGVNLRNLTAHGFVDAVGPVYAALALRACILIVLITPDNAANQDAEAVRSSLMQPHAADIDSDQD